MRRFQNRIAEIVEESGIKLNSICKTSGVSHTYLTKVIRGQINCPGKDKIASILLAMNYTISQINEVLAGYDYQPLNKHDIPEIKKNNRKRKIEGTTMPLFDHIYVELLLVSLEQMGGTKLLIKNRPSSIYMPEDLYLWGEFPFETQEEARDFRIEFTLALFKERRELFLKNCAAGHRVENYICKHCLEEFIANKIPHADQKLSTKESRKQEMFLQYFANAMGAILRNPDQFKTHIVKRCAYFECQIQDAEGKSPKVSFPGKKLHDYETNRLDHISLEGFTSDAPATIKLFLNEIKLCRRTVEDDIAQNYPHSYLNYILDLFDKIGLKPALQSYIEESISKPEYSFL